MNDHLLEGKGSKGKKGRGRQRRKGSFKPGSTKAGQSYRTKQAQRREAAIQQSSTPALDKIAAYLKSIGHEHIDVRGNPEIRRRVLDAQRANQGSSPEEQENAMRREAIWAGSEQPSKEPTRTQAGRADFMAYTGRVSPADRANIKAYLQQRERSPEEIDPEEIEDSVLHVYKKIGQILSEVSPPGWGHTKTGGKKSVKVGGTADAMKKAKAEGRMPGVKNIFALMWSMKNKGDKPHYKPGKKGVLKKK
jgi:hypothetical protein